MLRRYFLSALAVLPFAAKDTIRAQTPSPLKIMFKSAWGSDDPTKAAFPFYHGHVLAEAGHEVQIFLLGEAVSLMRKSVADSIVPVGWPPLSEILPKIVEMKISIFACGKCSKARGITEEDLKNFNAQFGSPKIFVSLIEWADKVITE